MPSHVVGLQVRSTKNEGILELSLARVPIPEPKPDEVVVRIDASPINPSDLGTDVSAAKVSGTPDDPRLERRGQNFCEPQTLVSLVAAFAARMIHVRSHERGPSRGPATACQSAKYTVFGRDRWCCLYKYVV